MDLALLVYSISVLTIINALTVLVLFMALAVNGISSIVYFAGYHKSEIDTSIRFWKYSAVALAITVPLAVLIPREKTMYTMVGAYAAQKVAEDTKVQNLSAKVLKIVENKLDSYIEEATTAKK